MMQQIVHPIARPRHLGWVSRAVVSGFLAGVVALLVMIAAYGFAAAVGSTNPNAGFFAKWMWALANNPLTTLVNKVHVVQAVGLHLAVGIIWGVVYAAIFERVLQGPGWLKGLLFAILPCLVSLFIFLPIVGAGVFGAVVGAGPMAAIGAILLHAVYGFVLGETYALADGEGLLGGVDSPQAKTFTLVERDMAAGLILGALAGAIISLVLVAIGLASGGTDAVLTVIGGATEGAFTGIVIGIFVGLITA